VLFLALSRDAGLSSALILVSYHPFFSDVGFGLIQNRPKDQGGEEKA